MPANPPSPAASVAPAEDAAAGEREPPVRRLHQRADPTMVARSLMERRAQVQRGGCPAAHGQHVPPAARRKLPPRPTCGPLPALSLVAFPPAASFCGLAELSCRLHARAFLGTATPTPDHVTPSHVAQSCRCRPSATYAAPAHLHSSSTNTEL